MKKLIFCLCFSLTFLTGCGEDDETFVEDDDVNTEDPTDDDPDPDPNEEFVLLPGETSSYLVDPAATPETVALFYHLKTLSETNFVVGQQDAFNAFYNNTGGESDMKKTTGSDPGMLGSDFMFITDDNNNGDPSNWFYQQEQTIISDAIEAYNKGMVNTFSWHLREPYDGETFYADEMTEFQRQNAFSSILPGGANHEYYKQKLQKVAEVVLSLQGADGTLSPVIFRPFHEFDGNWFWWGAAYVSPQDYKALWRFTVEYLRDELNVHNILYAYSPDNSYSTSAMYLQRYPGDEYVDILGMDNYGDVESQSGSGIATANNKMKMVSDLAIEKVKIAALTETGYFVDAQNPLPPNFYSEKLYEVLTGNDLEIGYMMFWQNYENSYTVPTPGETGENDFLQFINEEEPLLQDDLIDVYTLPSE